MTDALERLAAKWARHKPLSGDIHGTPLDVLALPDARWWALAVAELLAEEATTIATERKSTPDQWRDTSAYRESARYLQGIAAPEEGT